MVKLCLAIEVYKLCHVSFFSIYHDVFLGLKSGRTFLESVNCELYIWMKTVELVQNFVNNQSFDKKEDVIDTSSVEYD